MMQKLSGWSLPLIGVGTGAWMSPFPAIPQEQALELVHYTLSQGKALFDTAPRYGGGVSETWLGEGLFGAPRESYIISTKAPAGYGKDHLTRDNILSSLDASLKRLHTSFVDILHLHDPDCCLEDALNLLYPTLDELRSQGVIKAVGAGMNQWQMLAEFARNADFDCFLLASRYTLLEQDSLGFLDLCYQKGIALFLGGVFNTGILATGAGPGARYNYRPAAPQILERVQRIEAVCAAYNVALHAAALQFPLAHPAVRSLVIGAQSAAEFAENLAAIEAPIPQAFWLELRAQGLISPSAPIPVEEKPPMQGKETN